MRYIFMEMISAYDFSFRKTKMETIGKIEIWFRIFLHFF